MLYDTPPRRAVSIRKILIHLAAFVYKQARKTLNDAAHIMRYTTLVYMVLLVYIHKRRRRASVIYNVLKYFVGARARHLRCVRTRVYVSDNSVVVRFIALRMQNKLKQNSLKRVARTPHTSHPYIRTRMCTKHALKKVGVVFGDICLHVYRSFELTRI